MGKQKKGSYNGRILRVDLSDGRTRVEEPDDKFYRRYVGGTGFSGYFLVKELKPGIDPLGPQNKLVFSTGAITGIPAAGNARSAVGSKSPLTGGFGDSQCGGFWPVELKRAGWDAVIVEGRADKPVYLYIEDDKVELKDAGHLWGKPTAEVQEQIQAELGDERVRVAQIGPAGEKLARYACILNDLNHAHGRNGHGAVMGSKNLRAIAVRGHGKARAADPDRVHAVAKWLTDNYKTVSKGLTEFGTASQVAWLNSLGMLPTRNFQEGQFEGFEGISAPKMVESILVGRGNCYGCPINCKREVQVGAPYDVEPKYGGPEYETIGALGSLCGVGDIKAVAKANQLCQKYGIDTISTGVSVAFAMECFERGILGKADTGGIELRFGNAEGLMAMVEMIGRREGLGELLGEGVRRAAKSIGNGSESFAVHVKGQELAVQDPRGKFGMALGYATSPTGADHIQSVYDNLYTQDSPLMDLPRTFGILDPLPYTDLGPAKVRMFVYLVNWTHFKNCAVLCVFLPYNPSQVVELVAGATGWNTSLWELVKVGERALSLGRVFNAREGFTAADDVLPDRIRQAFPSGPLQGVEIPRQAVDEALQTYYAMMNWDPVKAAPTAGKLHELDLSWAIS